MVLFMVGWIAGYMFLNRAWQRAVLVLIVIPLAIIRNGFRICVVGELCVRISHDMINSPIHRKGGRLFFAMSLVPFVLILVFLEKIQCTRNPTHQNAAATWYMIMKIFHRQWPCS